MKRYVGYRRRWFRPQIHDNNTLRWVYISTLSDEDLKEEMFDPYGIEDDFTSLLESYKEDYLEDLKNERITAHRNDLTEYERMTSSEYSRNSGDHNPTQLSDSSSSNYSSNNNGGSFSSGSGGD